MAGLRYSTLGHGHGVDRLRRQSRNDVFVLVLDAEQFVRSKSRLVELNRTCSTSKDEKWRNHCGLTISSLHGVLDGVVVSVND